MSEYGSFKNIERQKAMEYEERHWMPTNRRLPFFQRHKEVIWTVLLVVALLAVIWANVRLFAEAL